MLLLRTQSLLTGGTSWRGLYNLQSPYNLIYHPFFLTNEVAL